MNKEKQFYLDCLKDGKRRHDRIYAKMKSRFEASATVIRDILIAEGYVEEAGYVCRKDGKRMHFYKLTGKKFKSTEDAVIQESIRWEDGSIKSQGNAFNWKSYAKGIFKPGEIAAQEAGRKYGITSASKKILPRVSI